jgi:general secretion pathway protein A
MALDMLTYGVAERKGLILLTGEIGTGKTTMIQALLSNLDNTVRHIYLSNPLLSPRDFMNYLAFSTFKRKVHFKSKADFLKEFTQFLWQCLRGQQTTILIIDEAQKLSFDVLEEIRLLSEMEINDEKLINVFLVGQPELLEKLSEPRCRQILQRITYRYHIPPLDLNGTREYMSTRLRKAGAKSEKSIFSKNAIEAIYRYSGGYPRTINVLADNSLLLGFSKVKSKITARMVKQSYEDLGLNDFFPSSGENAPASYEITKAKGVNGGRFWKWAAAVCFIALVIFMGMCTKESAVLRRLSGLAPDSQQSRSGNAAGKHVTIEKAIGARMEEAKNQESVGVLRETEEAGAGIAVREGAQKVRQVFLEE